MRTSNIVANGLIQKKEHNRHNYATYNKNSDLQFHLQIRSKYIAYNIVPGNDYSPVKTTL